MRGGDTPIILRRGVSPKITHPPSSKIGGGVPKNRGGVGGPQQTLHLRGVDGIEGGKRGVPQKRPEI